MDDNAATSPSTLTEDFAHFAVTTSYDQLVRYEAAVAWVEGDVAPAAFEDVAVQRDEYQKVMARTVVESDVGVAQQEAYAEVQTSDGGRHAVHVPFARGTVQQPLTDDDLHARKSVV